MTAKWQRDERKRGRERKREVSAKVYETKLWPPRRSTCPLRGSRCPVRPTRSSPASSWNASLTLSTRNDDFSEKEKRKRNELVTHTDRYTRSIRVAFAIGDVKFILIRMRDPIVYGRKRYVFSRVRGGGGGGSNNNNKCSVEIIFWLNILLFNFSFLISFVLLPFFLPLFESSHI